jgi:hypothetical protein
MQVNLKALEKGGRVTNGFQKMKIESLNKVLSTSKIGFGVHGLNRKDRLSTQTVINNKMKFAHEGQLHTDDSYYNHDVMY